MTDEKIMTIETLRNDLDGDYANYSIAYIVDLLLLEADDRGVFYDKWLADKRDIFTPREYFERQCELDQSLYPDSENIPQDLIDRLNVLEGLVAEMRNALESKYMPEEIYAILLRFKSEGGLGQVPHIKELEF